MRRDLTEVRWHRLLSDETDEDSSGPSDGRRRTEYGRCLCLEGVHCADVNMGQTIVQSENKLENPMHSGSQGGHFWRSQKKLGCGRNLERQKP